MQLLVGLCFRWYLVPTCSNVKFGSPLVREMPNVLVLPRSADYSEEVWTEIREKDISILQMYFLDGAVPSNAVSDEEDGESEITYENEQFDRQDKEKALHSAVEQLPAESPTVSASFQGKGPMQLESTSQHQESDLSPSISKQSDGKRSRSRKKAKKRHGRQTSQNKPEDIVEDKSASQQDDDTAMSGTEQVQSSGSRCAPPGDSRSRKTPIELSQESSASLLQKSGKSVSKKSGEQLKDGCVIALHAKEHSTLYVSRQRVKGGGWFLDTMSGVTKRDPAAQFLVVFGSKDSIGLRSLAARGKLLQIIRKMEFVFASHNFYVWESWSLEGPLEECRLVNCRNTQASLDVRG